MTEAQAATPQDPAGAIVTEEPAVEAAQTPIAPEAPDTVEPVAPAAQTGAAPPPQQVQTPQEPPVQAPQEPIAEPGTAQSVRVVPKAGGYELPKGVPAEFGEFASKNDMTQDQVTATLTRFNGYISNSQKKFQENLRVQGDEHVNSWGDKSGENLSLAKRALQQYDKSGQLTEALNSTGYGNHPAVIEFLFKIGSGLKEGGFLQGKVNRPNARKDTSMAHRMYPNDVPK